MASIQEQERQLFEKFWKGTFKAVAMPRPESIIVASITAGRTLTKSCQDTSVSLPPKVSERKVETRETAAVAKQQNGRAKKRGHKHRSHHHARSGSFDGDLCPRPKRKKKKKKSERKRRRERAPSYSPSPVRRRKKKKKSSKKRKQHRTASKKRRHSSSTIKRKRKEERKHKKRSRSHTHRRRRHLRSGAEGSAWNTSSTDSRQHLHASDPFQPNTAGLGDAHHLDADQRALDWGSAVELASKTPPHFSCTAPDSTISQSKSGGEKAHKRTILHDTPSSRNKGPQDYDSGNDTSSPPSSKTGVSRSNVSRVKSILGRVDGDSASDSGNSVTSYVSQCRPTETASSSSYLLRHSKRAGSSTVCKAETRALSASLTPRRERHRTRSLSSASRSPSSASSHGSGSYYSRSPSRSFGKRSYSRSSAYSVDSRDGSVCSGRLSKYTPSRDGEWSKGRSTNEKQSKRGKKRRRRKSYSPMRKRRRDSPSHLEARRITSARKRPIPYYRPSPSSCSRASSISSLGSLFGIIRCANRSHTRSRSRSRSRSRTRSRSRSRRRSRSRSCSYSSYRSYSRSSSWDSLCGSRSRSGTRSWTHSRSRSRSRSYDSLGSYSRGRR